MQQPAVNARWERVWQLSALVSPSAIRIRRPDNWIPHCTTSNLQLESCQPFFRQVERVRQGKLGKCRYCTLLHIYSKQDRNHNRSTVNLPPNRFLNGHCLCQQIFLHLHFQRAFTACICVLKIITLVWANQNNFFENATVYKKRTLKTRVATSL